MAERVRWISFRAHPSRLREDDDQAPDYFGIFVCPLARSAPEELLGELLGNRSLFLAQVDSSRPEKAEEPWGLHERLKVQVQRQGYGLALTKVQRGPASMD
ncbi:MAG: hypothetical protein WDO13_14010 [Verrucomicrobiota bacterium]